MGGKYFEEFLLGEKVEGKPITVTESHVVQYAGISGDFNSLHIDEEFAKSTRWGRRIAHGMLTATLAIPGISPIVDGTAIAHTRDVFKYTAPVYIGDTIYPIFEVSGLEAKKRWGQVTCKLTVKNQRGEVVLEGESEMLVNFRNPPKA
ncbi:MAG: MaoC family dehydratase N-terminal domain-containing protein [Chloroflexi bacterium]|nr:MaoC family dehydratase N-terminal domain-containing protein [Chloroflexota bacterium]